MIEIEKIKTKYWFAGIAWQLIAARAGGAVEDR